jgi:hypothetical protein
MKSLVVQVADLTLELLRGELAPICDELRRHSAQLDGLPILTRNIIVLHKEVRQLRAAFNDFARTNVTSGEIEALHTDVNKAMADNRALEVRIATLERRLDELISR